MKTNENGKEKLYLAVWVLRGNKKAVVPVCGAKTASVAYPKNMPTTYELVDGVLSVEFTESDSARFFEIVY